MSITTRSIFNNVAQTETNNGDHGQLSVMNAVPELGTRSQSLMTYKSQYHFHERIEFKMGEQIRSALTSYEKPLLDRNEILDMVEDDKENRPYSLNSPSRSMPYANFKPLSAIHNTVHVQRIESQNNHPDDDTLIIKRILSETNFLLTVILNEANADHPLHSLQNLLANKSNLPLKQLFKMVVLHIQKIELQSVLINFQHSANVSQQHPIAIQLYTLFSSYIKHNDINSDKNNKNPLLSQLTAVRISIESSPRNKGCCFC